jgi:DNA-directed RNA polymerase I and III subunit RPAC1
MKRSSSKTKSPSKKEEPSQKTRATIQEHYIENAATFEHPSSFFGATARSEATDLKNSIDALQINVISKTEEKIVFDISGIEPPLANALRRIMIEEIPTMAIDKVDMWQNTSIIPDENLAHRMGLIPIKADPRLFNDMSGERNEANCIKFVLKV